MRHYTDDPDRDMENEYAERPQYIGVCPFCLERVQNTRDEFNNPLYIKSYNTNREPAHRGCLEKYDRLRQDYPLFI